MQDDKGELRRYLFDSNVRAFLGANLVNADISETLATDVGPNFWWLNNGITILATSASLVGKMLKLRDIQIVNGLQTTESIHRHFAHSLNTTQENRSLLVKVIVSQDETVRDQVIRATNNQSAVEPAALHATDRIQRNIEDILLRNDWYYERRTNYYKNEERPEARIISPLQLATGSVALILKDCVKSSKLKQRHLRAPESYNAIYSEHFPLNVWPSVAALVRSSENAITRGRRTKGVARGKYLSAWRGPLAFITAARITGSFSFKHHDVAAINSASLTDSFMDECWTLVKQTVGASNADKVTEAQIMAIAHKCETEWGVSGHPMDGRRQLPSSTASTGQIDEESFLQAVNSLLPPQPWKPHIHSNIAHTLGARPARVSRAIKELIARGAWMQQVDGIVYDKDGKEIARDESRAR